MSIGGPRRIAITFAGELRRCCEKVLNILHTLLYFSVILHVLNHRRALAKKAKEREQREAQELLAQREARRKQAQDDALCPPRRYV